MRVRTTPILKIAQYLLNNFLLVLIGKSIAPTLNLIMLLPNWVQLTTEEPPCYRPLKKCLF